MSDHYHHASEIQGAADDRHGHTPREIGAAEEHDLDMLERRVRGLEQDVQVLERDKAAQDRTIAGLQADVRSLADSVSTLMGLVRGAAEEGRI